MTVPVTLEVLNDFSIHEFPDRVRDSLAVFDPRNLLDLGIAREARIVRGDDKKDPHGIDRYLRAPDQRVRNLCEISLHSLPLKTNVPFSQCCTRNHD